MLGSSPVGEAAGAWEVVLRRREVGDRRRVSWKVLVLFLVLGRMESQMVEGHRRVSQRVVLEVRHRESRMVGGHRMDLPGEEGLARVYHMGGYTDRLRKEGDRLRSGDGRSRMEAVEAVEAVGKEAAGKPDRTADRARSTKPCWT